MGRSVHSKPYKDFLALMITARESAGLTQSTLAERIGRTQSFVSKYERGERRLDVVEFAEFVKAMDLDPRALFANFVGQAFEDSSKQTTKRSVRGPAPSAIGGRTRQSGAPKGRRR